jgi:hypothetical protein
VEAPLPLGPLPHPGVEEAVGAVEPLVETADLGADEPLRRGVPMIAVQLYNTSALDRDGEAAGVRTVQGAGAVERGSVGHILGVHRGARSVSLFEISPRMAWIRRKE